MSVSLSARNIVKRYGGVVALSDGNLDVRSGEVVALIGANGSGKSTMSKVINGVVVLDGGQLLLDGKPVRFSSPQAARKMGIATVFQELSLVSKMTVADNIWLTREPLKLNGTIDRKAMNEKTNALLDLFSGTFKADLKPDTLVSALHPDEKQIVEILKAISLNPRISGATLSSYKPAPKPAPNPETVYSRPEPTYHPVSLSAKSSRGTNTQTRR